MDLASLFESSTPQGLVSANYTGILSPKLFVEAQYSRRRLSMVGLGSRFTDRVRGTVILDRSRDNARWNSPTLCAVCGAREGKLSEAKRNNQNVIVKGSYFLSTSGAGSHNIVFGLDAFEDSRKDDNWPSGSGFWVSATSTIIRGEQLFPVFTPRTTFIQWRPVLQTSQGSELRTYSAFLNDTWRLSKRWSFNLGVRWDKNDAKDQSGTRVADHSAGSPRLSATFDPTGDGKWTVNGGLARYAIPVTSGIADLGSAGGRQAIFQYDYLGPSINADLDTASPASADQALRQLFDWFFANGGTDRPLRGTPTYPGVNRVVGKGLVLPSAWEGSLGFSRKLGGKGLFRLDGLWREYRDFYAEKVDTTTGKATDPRGSRYRISPR